LIQLVAYGTQDIVLSTNPEITFFKVIFRRITNFAIESISQTFNGTVGFNKSVSADISRNGDLISDCWLEIVMKKSGDTFYPAEALIKEIKLEIGGQQIDKHYADSLRLHDALFRTDDEARAYRRLTDFVDNEPAGTVKRFYLPLVFYFNTQPGLALPLIALQYHVVRILIDFASTVDGVSTSSDDLQVTLWVDYVFLDQEERKRFATSAHEYLIEQTQFTGSETVTISATNTTSVRTRLNFNHPCKYLAWVFKGSKHGQYTAYPTSDVSNTSTFAEALGPLHDAKLTLNGHDRFDTRRGSYFNMVQPMQTMKKRVPAGVYLYSFALKPHEHQPSGTCNFSRIDNATLQLTLKKANVSNASMTALSPVPSALGEDFTITNAQSLTMLNIYAKNYNILRIMSGMGGLAYAA
jgi:hypothetical protein